MLQHKFLDSTDKITLTIPGNFFPSGGKFIGIELGGIPGNPFMKTVPGYWFVLQNTTTITVDGKFETFLVGSKLDKEKT